MQEKNVEIFFQNVSRFWNFGALFIVKQHFFKQTFLQKGSLELAHIRSGYSPDLSWLYPALGIDVQFQRHISWKTVRCVSAIGHRWAKPFFQPWNWIKGNLCSLWNGGGGETATLSSIEQKCRRQVSRITDSLCIILPWCKWPCYAQDGFDSAKKAQFLAINLHFWPPRTPGS